MVTCFRIIAIMLILGTLGITNSIAEENNMALSLEKQLLRDEGMRLDVYRDHLGKPTVGVGHLVLAKDKLKVGDKISSSRALQLFRNDIKIATKDAKIYVGADKFDSLPKPIQNVVVNMSFQMGGTKLRKFTEMKKAIEKRDYKAMAKEMKKSKWYKQTPERANRLIADVLEVDSLEDNSGKVFVEGYTRSDGVKIPGHFRNILKKIFGAK